MELELLEPLAPGIEGEPFEREDDEVLGIDGPPEDDEDDALGIEGEDEDELLELELEELLGMLGPPELEELELDELGMELELLELCCCCCDWQPASTSVSAETVRKARAGLREIVRLLMVGIRPAIASARPTACYLSVYYRKSVPGSIRNNYQIQLRLYIAGIRHQDPKSHAPISIVPGQHRKAGLNTV